MPMPVDFDPSTYTRTPNLDVASLIALARQLIAAAPARPRALLKSSLLELKEATATLESSYRAHLYVPAALDSRPVDQAADNVWGCIYARLDSYARLPVARYPKAQRARELQTKLFPTGLVFIKLEYGAQWVEAEQRIQLIRQEHLSHELDELVGPEFMSELAYCHTLYGEMVGVLQAKKTRQKAPDLRAPRLRTQKALTAHTIQLLAVYMGGDVKAQAALQPSFAAIDAYRDKAAVEKKKPAHQPTPQQPMECSSMQQWIYNPPAARKSSPPRALAAPPGAPSRRPVSYPPQR